MDLVGLISLESLRDISNDHIEDDDLDNHSHE